MDLKVFAAASVSLILLVNSNFAMAAAPDVQVQTIDVQPPSTGGVDYSPNGLHCAYVAPLGSRSTVAFDGKAQGKFDQVQNWGQASGSFLFSSDGAHMAFAARHGQDTFIVADGVQQPVGTYLSSVTEMAFSPDGKQFAFTVNARPAPAHVMLNGKPQDDQLSVQSLSFSSNSKHFAYFATHKHDPSTDDPNGPRTTQKSFIVYDGTAGPEQDQTKMLILSPEGDHYAYVGRVMDKNPPGTAVSYHEHLYIDGKDQVAPDTIDHIVFSADGKHVACMIQIKKAGQNPSASNPVMDNFIWFDGQKLPFNNRGSHSGEMPLISPDGTAVAYIEDATPDGSSNTVVVAINGKPGEEYQNITDLHFYGDHSAIYQAHQMASQQQKQTYFVVDNGNEAGPYQMTPNAGQGGNFGILISPDGKHTAYSGQDGTNVFIVLDGKPGPKLERIDRKPMFSPDSQHLAAIAYQDPAKNMAPIQRQQYEQTHPGAIGETLVLDGQMTPLGANVGCDLVFSPDSKHWAIVAGGAGGGPTHLIVDGRPIFLPKDAVAPTPPQFTADSAHLVDICGSSQQSSYGGWALIIDGTPLAGYGIPSAAAAATTNSPLQMLPDGSMHAFAVKGADKSFVALTIKPAPADKFGSSDPGKQSTSPNNSTVAANNTNSQSNQQQQNQQQSSSPQQQADNAENQVNKANDNVQKANDAAQNAKNAGSAIGNLFKHHH